MMSDKKLALHFYTPGMYGHINLNLGLAQAMCQAGHAVIYHSDATFRDYIVQHDVPFAACSLQEVKDGFFAQTMLHLLRDAEHYLQEHLERIRQAPPDGIVAQGLRIKTC